MNISHIEHIGIAVENLEDAINKWNERNLNIHSQINLGRKTETRIQNPEIRTQEPSALTKSPGNDNSKPDVVDPKIGTAVAAEGTAGEPITAEPGTAAQHSDRALIGKVVALLGATRIQGGALFIIF